MGDDEEILCSGEKYDTIERREEEDEDEDEDEMKMDEDEDIIKKHDEQDAIKMNREGYHQEMRYRLSRNEQ